MIFGFAGVMWRPPIVSEQSSSGDVPVDGPLGVDLLDRRKADVDFEAILAKAAARSGSCMSVVRRDRRETRFGLESTRWNSGLSFTRGSALSETESSQSEPSSSSTSSSSIALSETSSSSSDSKTSSSSSARLLMVLDSTSSLKEVCFLERRGCFSPAVKELCLGCESIRSSNELSSSPDDPPSKNMRFGLSSSFFPCMGVLVGMGEGARCVVDLYEEEI